MTLPCVVVAVDALDELSREGFIRYLELAAPHVDVRAAGECENPVVVVFTIDAMDEVVQRTLAATMRELRCPSVLVVDSITRCDPSALAACRPAAVLSRSSLTVAALAAVIRKVVLAECVSLPDTDELLVAAARAGVRVTELSARETEVLRLLSDGLSTAEIAFQLMFSEGTVKSVLRRLNERIGLRGRSHAVAYAIRTGEI